MPALGWVRAGRTRSRSARPGRRGNRGVKRALFLAARAAIRGDNALARRYKARRQEGWKDDKATRDTARTILCIAVALWTKETDYNDAAVSLPRTAGKVGVGAGGRESQPGKGRAGQRAVRLSAKRSRRRESFGRVMTHLEVQRFD